MKYRVRHKDGLCLHFEYYSDNTYGCALVPDPKIPWCDVTVFNTKEEAVQAMVRTAFGISNLSVEEIPA